MVGAVIPTFPPAPATEAEDVIPASLAVDPARVTPPGAVMADMNSMEPVEGTSVTTVPAAIVDSARIEPVELNLNADGATHLPTDDLMLTNPEAPMVSDSEPVVASMVPSNVNEEPEDDTATFAATVIAWPNETAPVAAISPMIFTGALDEAKAPVTEIPLSVTKPVLVKLIELLKTEYLLNVTE